MAGTELTAVITNTGRERHAQMLVTGKSFKITHFTVGTQGHDPGDPMIATNPDPSAVEVAGAVFGPEPYDSASYLTPTCPAWECVLEFGEAVGAGISSLGLIATIVANGSDPVDEVGLQFLYALAHFPRKPKTNNDRFDFEAGVQI